MLDFSEMQRRGATRGTCTCGRCTPTTVPHVVITQPIWSPLADNRENVLLTVHESHGLAALVGSMATLLDDTEAKVNVLTDRADELDEALEDALVQAHHRLIWAQVGWTFVAVLGGIVGASLLA